VTETLAPPSPAPENTAQENTAPRSLATAAAKNLATTTKSVPQMQGVTPRWLLQVLPWVQVSGGTYRVNRRLAYAVGSGRVAFSSAGDAVSVIPPSLSELPWLRGLGDPGLLDALAGRFTQQEFDAGQVIAEAGEPADRLVLIAHGKVSKISAGKYGHEAVVGTLADGDHFGEQALTSAQGEWKFTATAATACIVLALPRQAFEEVAGQSAELRAHLERYTARSALPRNGRGEASIEVASGHEGETELPGTFADYELTPREYQLHVAQTVLGVHTRVADLYSEPMDQVEHQLRLTIEALRERQEHELINNPDIGLLHNADLSQRLQTRNGPPTPDDLDELLCRRRKTRFFLAHPRAIAAFGRQCNQRGIYPPTAEVSGRPVHAWRGVPLLPCNKIPISPAAVTSILAMRTGEEDQGVIGLHQTGIPDEYQPGLSVRFKGIDEKAVISYLVSAYYSAAVLVPDALGVLENVEIGH
jgi:CRP-like cAMP-binding protein